MSPAPLQLLQRAVAALGALFCAFGVALGAYAAHGAALEAASRLDRASLYLMLHGAAVATLMLARPLVVSARWACALILLGVVLFAGSLAAAVLFGWPTALAPMGGILLIIGWLGLGLCVILPKRQR